MNSLAFSVATSDGRPSSSGSGAPHDLPAGRSGSGRPGPSSSGSGAHLGRPGPPVPALPFLPMAQAGLTGGAISSTAPLPGIDERPQSAGSGSTDVSLALSKSTASGHRGSSGSNRKVVDSASALTQSALKAHTIAHNSSSAFAEEDEVTPRTEKSSRGLKGAFGDLKGKMFGSSSKAPKGAEPPTPPEPPPVQEQAELSPEPIWGKAVEAASRPTTAETGAAQTAPSRFMEALRETQAAVDAAPPLKSPPPEPQVPEEAAAPSRFLQALGKTPDEAPALPARFLQALGKPVEETPPRVAPPEPPLPEVMEAPTAPAPPEPPAPEVVEPAPADVPAESLAPCPPEPPAPEVLEHVPAAAFPGLLAPVPPVPEVVELPKVDVAPSQPTPPQPEVLEVPPVPSRSPRQAPPPPPRPLDLSEDTQGPSRDGMAVPQSPSLYRPGKRMPGMPDSPSSGAEGETSSAPPPPPRPPGRPESPSQGPGPPMESPEGGITRHKMHGSLGDWAAGRKGPPQSPQAAPVPDTPKQPPKAPPGKPGKPPPPPEKGGMLKKGPGPMMSIETDNLEDTINSTQSDRMSPSGGSSSPNKGGKKHISLGRMAQSSNSAVRALPKPPSPSNANAAAKASPSSGPSRPSTALEARRDSNPVNQMGSPFARPPDASGSSMQAGGTMPPAPPRPPGVASSPKVKGPGPAW